MNGFYKIDKALFWLMAFDVVLGLFNDIIRIFYHL